MPVLNLHLPDGADQFDAAVFDQSGAFIMCGHHEECELRAANLGALYCWIVDGRAVVRRDYEELNANIFPPEVAAGLRENEQLVIALGKLADELEPRLRAALKRGGDDDPEYRALVIASGALHEKIVATNSETLDVRREYSSQCSDGGDI